jgi:serine/threonine-protein kinase RsbT
VPNETRVTIHHDSDVLAAVREGRELAAQAGFAGTDLAIIGTAISEVARNILVHAKRGEVSLGVVERAGGKGVLIVAEDEGPGIADIEQAMQDGFSTGKTLGFGLPGAKRLMDEFEIDSEVGKGTTITMRKWTR